jgi:tetratricopeptide (TPR) repeat protein
MAELTKEQKDMLEEIADKVAAEVVKEEEPNQFESVDQRQQRRKHEIQKVLEEGEVIAMEGVEFFLARDENGQAKAIFDKIRAALPALMGSPADKQSLKGVLNQDDYNVLNKLAMAAYEEKEYKPASAMFSVIVRLFIEEIQIQPFIMLALCEWQLNGIEAATKVYDLYLQMFEDPLLCYYAADCFIKAGRKTEARNAIERGIQLIDAGKVLEGREELEREMNKLLESVK